VDKILQLLHVYPADKKNQDGKYFWSLPKRPPSPINFDPQNELHSSAIAATACLIANMHKIDLNKEYLHENGKPRSLESKFLMA
jgi:hypothetical protein